MRESSLMHSKLAEADHLLRLSICEQISRHSTPMICSIAHPYRQLNMVLITPVSAPLSAQDLFLHAQGALWASSRSHDIAVKESLLGPQSLCYHSLVHSPPLWTGAATRRYAIDKTRQGAAGGRASMVWRRRRLDTCLPV